MNLQIHVRNIASTGHFGGVFTRGLESVTITNYFWYLLARHRDHQNASWRELRPKFITQASLSSSFTTSYIQQSASVVESDFSQSAKTSARVENLALLSQLEKSNQARIM